MVKVQGKSDNVTALASSQGKSQVFHLQVSVESQVVRFSVELNQVQDIMNSAHIIALYLCHRLQQKVFATTKKGKINCKCLGK